MTKRFNPAEVAVIAGGCNDLVLLWTFDNDEEFREQVDESFIMQLDENDKKGHKYTFMYPPKTYRDSSAFQEVSKCRNYKKLELLFESWFHLGSGHPLLKLIPVDQSTRAAAAARSADHLNQKSTIPVYQEDLKIGLPPPPKAAAPSSHLPPQPPRQPPLNRPINPAKSSLKPGPAAVNTPETFLTPPSASLPQKNLKQAAVARLDGEIGAVSSAVGGAGDTAKTPNANRSPTKQRSLANLAIKPAKEDEDEQSAALTDSAKKLARLKERTDEVTATMTRLLEQNTKIAEKKKKMQQIKRPGAKIAEIKKKLEEKEEANVRGITEQEAARKKLSEEIQELLKEAQNSMFDWIVLERTVRNGCDFKPDGIRGSVVQRKAPKNDELAVAFMRSARGCAEAATKRKQEFEEWLDRLDQVALWK